MKRSSHVGLGVTMIAASALSGCAGDEPEYAAICVNPQTQQRIDDDNCDDGDHPRDYSGTGNGFFWYYLGTQSGHRVPPVGSHYSGGTYNGSRLAKTHNVQRGGVPKSGAKSFKSYSKSGGFGSSKGVSSS